MTRRNLGKKNNAEADSVKKEYIQSIRDKCDLEIAPKGEFDTPYAHCLPKNYKARLRTDIISALILDEAKERYGVTEEGNLNDADLTNESSNSRLNNRDYIFAYQKNTKNKYEFCHIKFMSVGMLKTISEEEKSCDMIV